MSSGCENASTTTPGAVASFSPARGVEDRMVACALAGPGASARTRAKKPAAKILPPPLAGEARGGDATREGSARIHRIDLRAVAVHDHAPAHLQRRRQLARLRGPLRRQHRAALDLLHAGQALVRRVDRARDTDQDLGGP